MGSYYHQCKSESNGLGMKVNCKSDYHPQDQLNQAGFLHNLGLQPSSNKSTHPCSEEFISNEVYNVNLSKIDLSSPIGQIALKLSESSCTISDIKESVEQYESYCANTNPLPSCGQYSCKPFSQVTFKYKHKRNRRPYSHTYCFNSWQKRDRKIALKTGLDRRARWLLSKCKPSCVLVKRLPCEKVTEYLRKSCQRQENVLSGDIKQKINTSQFLVSHTHSPDKETYEDGNLVIDLCSDSESSSDDDVMIIEESRTCFTSPGCVKEFKNKNPFARSNPKSLLSTLFSKAAKKNFSNNNKTIKNNNLSRESVHAVSSYKTAKGRKIFPKSNHVIKIHNKNPKDVIKKCSIKLINVIDRIRNGSVLVDGRKIKVARVPSTIYNKPAIFNTSKKRTTLSDSYTKQSYVRLEKISVIPSASSDDVNNKQKPDSSAINIDLEITKPSLLFQLNLEDSYETENSSSSDEEAERALGILAAKQQQNYIQNQLSQSCDSGFSERKSNMDLQQSFLCSTNRMVSTLKNSSNTNVTNSNDTLCNGCENESLLKIAHTCQRDIIEVSSSRICSTPNTDSYSYDTQFQNYTEISSKSTFTHHRPTKTNQQNFKVVKNLNERVNQMYDKEFNRHRTSYVKSINRPLQILEEENNLKVLKVQKVDMFSSPSHIIENGKYIPPTSSVLEKRVFNNSVNPHTSLPVRNIEQRNKTSLVFTNNHTSCNSYQRNCSPTSVNGYQRSSSPVSTHYVRAQIMKADSCTFICYRCDLLMTSKRNVEQNIKFHLDLCHSGVSLNVIKTSFKSMRNGGKRCVLEAFKASSSDSGRGSSPRSDVL